MTEQINIDVEGLDEAIKKMSQYPALMNKEMSRNMRASLDVLHEKTPGYPPQRSDQKTPYRRTGTLGRSLGVSQSGGKIGTPSIYGVSQNGDNIQGRYGTNLSYAPYVIGTQQQAWMHKGWWWTMDVIRKAAEEKIVKIWQDMVKFILSK